MKAVYFASSAGFRQWLDRNHSHATELHVGFYKKSAGKGGMTYPEAVDEALCFGWIDGVVRKLDPVSYSHRFTPRKTGSIWSNVNVRHVARLTAARRMQPAGLAAFAARSAARTGIYAFESTSKKLPPAFEKKFRASEQAWKFFSAQAPSYQKLIIHKIVTGKQEATRLRWLDRAISDSAAGCRVGAPSNKTR